MSASPSLAANLEVYNRPEIAARYAELTHTSKCEAMIFSKYLRPGSHVLELGVGGARLTPYLSAEASRYIGIDYAEEMIRRCRMKFPAVDFVVADAADLSQFSDRSFDAVVFGYNGLDCLYPLERRLRCLRECHRVLRDDGVFIFSSHNPRAVWVRPAWDRERVREFVSKLVPETNFAFSVAVAMITVVKATTAAVKCLSSSADRLLRRIFSRAFWVGHGYLIDSSDGRVLTYHATAEHVCVGLRTCHFRVEEIAASDYPRPASRFVTDWLYYVATPTGIAKEVLCG
jgi:ubiquinone/menaquinone biosynthesis C-methylase UbiE